MQTTMVPEECNCWLKIGDVLQFVGSTEAGRGDFQAQHLEDKPWELDEYVVEAATKVVSIVREVLDWKSCQKAAISRLCIEEEVKTDIFDQGLEAGCQNDT